jgi:hypothetical protein
MEASPMKNGSLKEANVRLVLLNAQAVIRCNSTLDRNTEMPQFTTVPNNKINLLPKSCGIALDCAEQGPGWVYHLLEATNALLGQRRGKKRPYLVPSEIH